MPLSKKLTGKQFILYPALLLIITFIILGISVYVSDEARFERYAKNLFVSELAGNSLNLHYTLAYPENYDITEKTILPIYTGTSGTKQDDEELFSSLETLTDISRDNLDDDDAYTYDLLYRHLKLQLTGSSFDYYSEPFSPNSGIQSGLPVLLADYAFRCKQDVIDYLDILEQSRAYLEGLLKYETEKADAGLFMSDSSAKKVIEQCGVIMDKKMLADGTHFLQMTFRERLTGLISDGLITEQEAAAYLSENDRLLTTVMAPAYEQIADTFTLLTGKGKNENGLCYYPEGKAYYRYLFASSTGSHRSVAETKQLLFSDFKNNYSALMILLTKYPQLSDSSIVSACDFPMSDAGEILSSLKERITNDFPAFPADVKESAVIKTVSPSMENYCSPAYYLTPPIDDMSENIIYLNPKNNTDSLSLYTTLAHEGYPGHLYQTVYSQIYMSKTDASPIRYLLHYGGYVEGWAYYVENLSYEYAKEYMQNNNLATAYYEACRLTRNLHIGMYSLLDIAIHYDGATFAQVQQILRQIGITNPQTAKNIYEYIREEPCNYLKYYMGYLEIRLLKQEAIDLWGERFSLYEFHKFLLETGPSDFNGLHESLLSYSPDNHHPKEES